MPPNVAKFFWLNCTALALGVGVAWLKDPSLAASSNLGGISTVIIIQVLVAAIMLGLISLAAFGRQNWARWVLVILFALGTPIYAALFEKIFTTPLEGAISLFQVLLQLLGFYFIFTGDAVAWFRRTNSA